MAATEYTPVKKLKLDLANYRTVKQVDEKSAVEAIIAVSPDWFWSLTESILDSGYLPTENILVLRSGATRPSLTVKEGNRRISALKLIHGIIPLDGLPVPQSIINRIAAIEADWKKKNSSVPCVIYDLDEVATVNRIRSLTHGKGEKASRDAWTPVARARHNRDENGASEPALDILEKYLKTGKNLSAHQAQRWAGNYHLTVLEEAMKRYASRLGVLNSTELGKNYPKIKFINEFDNIIYDIGQELIGFSNLRNSDVAAKYGILAPVSSDSGSKPGGASSSANNSNSGVTGAGGKGETAGGAKSANEGASSSAVASKKPSAIPIHDERQVKRVIKKFAPKGANREKVASLLAELKNLTLKKNPIAFCFLLRSMFEISAKAYCQDHKSDGLSATAKDGNDKKLIELLKEVTNHLTANNTNREVQKALHGALTEMSKPTGLLSVVSMNQLIHNPRFAHQPSDIAILFGNVFPLLEAMNS